MDLVSSSYLASHRKSNVANIPIGTKRHLSQYKTRKEGMVFVPKEDVVYLRVPLSHDVLQLAMILPPGYGKCFSSSTTVFTKEGMCNIGNIRIGQEVLSYDSVQNKQMFKSVLAKEDNGQKEILSVKTQSNYELQVTENHRVYTLNGWKEAKELTTEDYLVLPKRFPKFKDVSISIEDNLFLQASAYIVAEGYFKRENAIEFCNSELYIDYSNLLSYLKFSYLDKEDLRSPGLHKITSHKDFYDYAVSKGLHPAKADGKELPALIWTAPKNVKARVLQILFDCDGSVHFKETGSKQRLIIEYSSKSKVLIQQILTLLLEFGIVCKLSSKFLGGSEYYRLCISSFDSIKSFLDNIDFLLKRKHDVIKLYFDKYNYDLNCSNPKEHLIPWRFLHLFVSPERNLEILNKIKADGHFSRNSINCKRFDIHLDVWFDKVKCIESKGVQQTWDVQVEGNENIFAGTLGYILAHNTRLAKRIMPYLFNDFGFKGLIFDCKGFEMYSGMFKTDDYSTLLPWEKSKVADVGPLNLKNYMPAFVRDKAEKFHLFERPENHYLEDFEVFSFQPRDIEEPLEVTTLKIASTAGMIFLDRIRPKILSGELNTCKKVLQYLKKSSIVYAAKENLVNVFSFMDSQHIMDDEYEGINLLRDWTNGFVPNISLLEPVPQYASFYVGKIMKTIYQRDISRRNKMFVIDDAAKVLGNDMKEETSLSVSMVKDILTLGRYKRYHLWIMAQSYKILNDKIFGMFQHKIFGKLGSQDLDLLSKFCSSDVGWKIKNLRYDPNRQIKEMLLVQPDNMTSQTFFPLGPLAKHI